MWRNQCPALGTLAAGLAHELNTPAAALVRVLKDIKPAMLERQRMNLVYGQQQIDDTHTAQWLNVRDRGESPIAQPDNDPLAPADREDVFAFKLKHGITVDRQYDRTLPTIMAFGSELNQVWTNLIDNAIDAVNEGTPDGAAPKIQITTQIQSDRLRIEIRDNGPGIPTAIQNRILEPFFTTKPMGKGSGLGLDLVRRIVENRHGGSLTIGSTPGNTVFTVLLPLERN